MLDRVDAEKSKLLGRKHIGYEIFDKDPKRAKFSTVITIDVSDDSYSLFYFDKDGTLLHYY